MEEKRDNILIVDDMENNRFTLKGIIENMGYRPILAENGEQALKVLKKIKPVLILLDIAMPKMDGFEVCQKIKEDVELRDIPVIFISAFGEVEDMVKGYKIGAAEYITKPFIPQVVEARVRLLIQLSINNEELKDMNKRLQISVLQRSEKEREEKKRLLQILLAVVKRFSKYEKEKMDRVGANSKIIAQALQLTTEYENKISDFFIDTISVSASLCNIGNISLPISLLEKDSYTNEEKVIMENHTLIGESIFKDIEKEGDYKDYLTIVKEVVKYHHENWDGSGYPDGLKGNKIPLSAQIVAIANEYVELTGEKYNNSRLDAIDIIASKADKTYSPEIVEVLKKIYRQLQ